LAKKAGGLEFRRDGNRRPIFADAGDPDDRAMLQALRRGAEVLKRHPRADMLPASETAGRKP
jgi:hypothetical protein